MATDYSALEGLTARGSVSHTWLRGRCVVDAGRFVGERGYGRWLAPDPVRHGG
jgi:dihydroorotase-like cyclic amidohydrolase